MSRRSQKQIKIITLDTETYNGLIGDLKRIAIYDGKKVYYGYKFEDIENVLLNYYELGFDVHIYIHNAEFDLRKLPELFSPDRVVWKKSLMINGKVATLACKKYTIHDSFKLLPMALSKLSSGFNVEHGKLDLWQAVKEKYPNQYEVYDSKGNFDKTGSLVNFLDKCDVEDPLYLEYLGYDVMSLYEVLEVLMDISGIELKDFVKRVSTASLSRFIFKNGYKGREFRQDGNNKSDYEMLCSYNWKDDEEIEDFLRASYCGGRVEVFKQRLEEQGYHDDVNSLYPSQMLGEFPIGKPDFTNKPILAKHHYEEWKRTRIGLGFINARVFIPLQSVPPLPVKMGKLTFPCGEVYGTWTYEELEYAESECGVEILEYICACHFEQTYPVFKNFIDCMYVLKEEATIEGNEPARTFSKLIQNTGYGYTGMRKDDKTTLVPYETPEQLALYKKKHRKEKYEEIIFADEELGFMEIPTTVTAEYIQVQVASYVTSRARLVLLKGLRSIIERGGTVFYCDTDSIVSDIGVSQELKHPTKLGFWDEESRPLKAIFLRPKVYTEIHEEKTPTIKFKGVSRDTQKDLDFEFYESLYSDLVDGKEKYKIVEKNRLTMRSIMYMQKEHLPFDYNETRDKKMNYNTVEKRVMDYSNNETHPHYFKTIEEFENFSFKPIKKHVVFDMTKKG